MKDSGPRSRCSGACALAWPPLTTREKPEARGGAKAKLLATSTRGNGARQVVYGGHPLYRYEPDTAAGQTRGQGVSAFGARWYVVAPSGHAITAAAAPAPSGSSTPAPYGY
jgi:predicted lipoprotein with Yx(FWY)xxD motif